MGGVKRAEILRILDANFNRCREGLRVCEEITRFVMADERLTRELKKTRHAVSDCLKKFPVTMAEIVSARDSRGDIGRKPSRLEKGRKSAKEIFLANMERSKEALRVLEETSKLFDEKISDQLKKIRFRVYSIEKKVIQKLETLRDHRS